jgi:hypothetical protein
VLLTDLSNPHTLFGVALAVNIAFTIFSGMAPLAATTSFRETGSAASRRRSLPEGGAGARRQRLAPALRPQRADAMMPMAGRT